jgi:HK97 family phage portal protein
VRLFGLEITRAKSAPLPSEAFHDRGWFSVIREPFTGAWQRNFEERRESVLTYSAVYSCVTLIAQDVGKLPVCLVEKGSDGIWSETESAAFSPVLRKPNRFQNRIKFYEQWVVSKLLHGNTYVLLERDARQVVVAMYVLDPMRTKPLVGTDGAIYYQLSADNLAGLEGPTITVPASEIIHDTMVPFYHPLCGVSPLTACGLAATQGLSIQRNSTAFFQNGSQPSGILTAPGNIDENDAARLKAHWESKYTGANAGKVAVVGSGLKYEAMTINAVDAQLIEQLKWSAETVCSCFHVPAYMVGVGAAPLNNNAQVLREQYYAQCLQALIEAIEISLDEGLGLGNVTGHSYGSQFDLDPLLRMDTPTQYKAISDGIGGGFLSPNEGRRKIDLKPVPGGDTPYLQQQNYSLAALDKRDRQDDPFASKAPAVSSATAPANDNNATDEEIAAAKVIAAWKLKSLLAA